MKVRYRVKGIDKSFSENFAPLWGIIRTNAGRPWDKVYSELCDVFDMRNHVNAHIIVHLFDFVETKTYIGDDGEIWIRDTYGDKQLKVAYCEYYVHPKNGLLLKNRYWKGWKSRYRGGKKEDPNVRIISKDLEFRRKDEESPWFVCEMKPLPKGVPVTKERPAYRAGKRPQMVTTYEYPVTIDAWTKQAITSFYGARYYCHSVRSANKKDLKKWGVV